MDGLNQLVPKSSKASRPTDGSTHVIREHIQCQAVDGQSIWGYANVSGAHSSLGAIQPSSSSRPRSRSLTDSCHAAHGVARRGVFTSHRGITIGAIVNESPLRPSAMVPCVSVRATDIPKPVARSRAAFAG